MNKNLIQTREEQKTKSRIIDIMKARCIRNELNEIFDVDMIDVYIRKMESLLEGNYFSLRTSEALRKSLDCLNKELVCHVNMRRDVLRYLASKPEEEYDKSKPVGKIYDMPKENRLISDRGIDEYIDFIDKYKSHSSLTGV